jgi:hypothetical protein
MSARKYDTLLTMYKCNGHSGLLYEYFSCHKARTHLMWFEFSILYPVAFSFENC